MVGGHGPSQERLRNLPRGTGVSASDHEIFDSDISLPASREHFGVIQILTEQQSGHFNLGANPHNDQKDQADGSANGGRGGKSEMEILTMKRILLRTQDLLRFPEDSESAVVLNIGEFNTSLVHGPTPGPRCEIAVR